MNCKPGDLAVVIRATSSPECVGKIVRCVRYEFCKLSSNDAWIVEPPIHGGKLFKGIFFAGDFVRDAHLRPLKYSDGEDEMLRIAGKPQEVNA